MIKKNWTILNIVLSLGVSTFFYTSQKAKSCIKISGYLDGNPATVIFVYGIVITVQFTTSKNRKCPKIM